MGGILAFDVSFSSGKGWKGGEKIGSRRSGRGWRERGEGNRKCWRCGESTGIGIAFESLK